MTPAYIALGSNLRDPPGQLRKAVAALKMLPDTQLQRVSSVYRSTAVGPGTQPDYFNAVLLLTTGLSPTALLDAMQQMSVLGRERIKLKLGEIDQVLVCGDQDRLKQVLVNLIGNAITYTPAGGVVTVGVGVGQAIGPILGGRIADAAQSFAPAFLLAAFVALILGAGASFLLPRRPHGEELAVEQPPRISV